MNFLANVCSLDLKNPVYHGFDIHWMQYINIWMHISARGFPNSTMVKNSPANAGDARGEDLIPGLGRSPGGGNSNPL